MVEKKRNVEQVGKWVWGVGGGVGGLGVELNLHPAHLPFPAFTECW